ncbi:MAG: hypothetical protein GY771_11635 [bacterium]|nr:hypothetical protein [bacterium]
MKRKLIYSLIITLVFCVFGCGGTDDADDGAEEELTLIPTTVTVVDRSGTVLPAGVTVYRADEKERIYDGLTGRTFELEAGKYDFRVQYNGGEKLFANREVSGEAADFTFKLPTGVLSVRCFSSGGDELDGVVLLFPPGYDGDIPAFRADCGEEITTVPGEYEIAVSVQDTILPRKTVTISKDAAVAETFILDTGYIIVKLMDFEGKPVPGEVRVYPAGDFNSAIAFGLIGEKIPVRPGSYDVVATAEGYSERSTGISVVSNQTSEEKLITYLYREGTDE